MDHLSEAPGDERLSWKRTAQHVVMTEPVLLKDEDEDYKALLNKHPL